MFRTLTLILTASIVVACASDAIAAYGQKWHSSEGSVVCDVGNTDNDPNIEILLLTYVTSGPYPWSCSSQLYLLDGATGLVEWTFEGIAVLETYGPFKGGPQLVDVDLDGRDEILFGTEYCQTSGAGGVYCFDFDVAVGVHDTQDSLSLPETYGLQQNFPNPFNPTTTIEYSVKERSHVTLTIYNALGQQVHILVDEVKEPGTHSVEWNGTGAQGDPLSTGVYFYAIRTESGEATRKMLLLK